VQSRAAVPVFPVIETLGASIVGNRFHDIGVDGVDLAGDPGARVAFNSFTDFHALAGDQPDVFQTAPPT
jgi:hypothetical protein